MYRVSIVKYLNSLPFYKGLTGYNFKKVPEFSLDVPSESAAKLVSGDVDIGLIPVAAIPMLKSPIIISDYCLAAQSDVKTVVLAYNGSFKDIKNVYLDNDSMTSVNMVKILNKHYWRGSFNFFSGLPGNKDDINAFVLIGDKAFNADKEYENIIDIAGEWKKFTGYSAVFACWAANKSIKQEFICEFNEALRIGVENINSIQHPNPKGYSLQKYLTENMSYVLDENKRNSMDLYLDYLNYV